jgi:hypothetical protein
MPDPGAGISTGLADKPALKVPGPARLTGDLNTSRKLRQLD